jgi:hypothetical protein
VRLVKKIVPVKFHLPEGYEGDDNACYRDECQLYDRRRKKSVFVIYPTDEAIRQLLIDICNRVYKLGIATAKLDISSKFYMRVQKNIVYDKCRNQRLVKVVNHGRRNEYVANAVLRELEAIEAL